LQVFFFFILLPEKINNVPSNTTDISYIINHLGEENENYFNAIAPPIIQTSNFSFPTVDEMRKAFEDEMGGYLYSRGLNPTVDILRKKLAALDGAEDALVFNSGAAAIFAGVLSNVKSGDHILSVHHPYSWALHMFDKILPRFGVTVTYADGTDTQSFLSNVQSNTTFIYLESPNSWWLDLQDLKAIASFAKPRGIVTMIDNSYCTPLYQKPIEMGIDLAMQTATKYIGGHSDAVHGAVVTNSELYAQKLKFIQNAVGAVPGPQDCFLILRGIKTLHIRVERACQNAAKIAEFLRSHSKIKQVFYPGFIDHPGHDIAASQMRHFCGMVSFNLITDTLDYAEKLLSNTTLFTLAESLGGVESLIGHPATMTHASIPREERLKVGLTDSLIRLSVGIEDVSDLIDDLNVAIDHLS
jgi:cystathionine beta-lyase/cystathionine gamma-synthase